MKLSGVASTSLFAYGFRPHFLAAGLAAFVLLPAWAAHLVLGLPLATDWPASLWHGHEMLYGFIAAAVAGFMLTAVPSWTGQRGFAGRPLVAVSSLWLAGRALIATSTHWPPVLVAVVDLAFIPAIGFLVAPLLLREGNRNTPLLAVLAILALLNAGFHLALIRGDTLLASRALLVAVDTILLLITVIGGRIVPAFTASALKQRGTDAVIRPIPYLTPAAIVTMIAVVLVDAGWPSGTAAGVIAALAALVHLLRMFQWRTFRTLREPIIWVLHLAYLWMPLGFALKALALLGGAGVAAFWLHALTAGAASTMILAVMTRAALGHTGRPLVAGPMITVAYFMLSGAALIRVFGPAASGNDYATVVLVAAVLWTAAFGLFLIVFAPILCTARVDGRPG